MIRVEDRPAIDSENPWPGIAPYDERDERYFRGREEQADMLFGLLSLGRTIVVYGLAGLGKTSLVHCGLFPRLRAAGMLPIPIRLRYESHDPPLRDQVFGAIGMAAGGLDTPSPVQGSLWEYFHRRGERFFTKRHRPVTPILVFDQFEEIFTLGAGQPQSRDFIEELSDLVEGRVPQAVRAQLEADDEAADRYLFQEHRYAVVLALREDFLPDLYSLRGKMPSLAANNLQLRRMDDRAARQVIAAGASLVAPEAVDPIIDFVAGATMPERRSERIEIEPALLNVVLRELNERRKHSGASKVDETLLDASGNRILKDFYERSLLGVSAKARDMVELALITKTGFRDNIEYERACEQYGLDNDALEALTQRRLIHIEERSGVKRVELTHDLLTAVIRESRDERARKATDRKLTVARGLAAIFFVMAAIAIGSILWGYRQQKMRRTETAAWAYRAASTSMTQGRLNFALAYLGVALRDDPSLLNAQRMAINLLTDKVWYVPVRRIGHDAAVTHAELSTDGTGLLTIAGNKVYVWDTHSGKKIVGPISAPSVWPSAHFRPNSSEIAVESLLGVDTWSTQTATLVWTTHVSAGRFQYSSDGKRLILYEADQRGFSVYDTETHRPLSSPIRRRVDESLIADHSGRWLLFGTDRAVVIHDLVTGQEKTWPIASRPIDADSSMQRGLLYIGLANGGLLVCNFGTGTLQLAGDGGPGLEALRIAPAGDKLLTLAGRRGQLWNLSDFSKMAEAMEHDMDIDPEATRFTDDGTRIFTMGGTEGHYWDATTGEPVSAPIWRDPPIVKSSSSGDGALVATVSANEQDVVLWSTPGTLKPVVPFVSDISRVQVSPDGTRFATREEVNPGEWDVRTWEAATGKLVEDFGNVDAVSPDVRTALRADATQVVLTSAGREVSLPLEGEADGCDFSPDGSHFMVHLKTGKLEVFSTDERRHLVTLAVGAPWSPEMTLSPDGSRVFSKKHGLDSTGVLWDCRTQTRVDLKVSSARFSDDGRMIVGVSGMKAEIFDAASGRHVATLPHDVQPRDAAFADADSRVMTIGWDGTVHLWDVATGTKMGSIRVGTTVLDANLNTATQFLTLRSGNGVDDIVQVWDVSLQPQAAVLIAPALPDSAHDRPRISFTRPLPTVDGSVNFFRLETVSAADASTVADLAEAVAGIRMELGAPLAVEPRINASKAVENETVAALLAAYGFVSRERPAFPGAKVTIREFVRNRLQAENDEADRADLRAEFAILYPGVNVPALPPSP